LKYLQGKKGNGYIAYLGIAMSKTAKKGEKRGKNALNCIKNNIIF